MKPSPPTPYHATLVTSIALADLENNQASGKAFGDGCWDGVSHCASWNAAATGMARRGGLLYYGAVSAADRIAALADVSTRKADVLNGSYNATVGDCEIENSTPEEDAIEDAYDEGVFVVMSAGNNGVGGGCNVNAPGDTPKAFTVNSIDVFGAGCFGDYTSCDILSRASAEGGADIVVNGSPHTGVVTMVDLVAPGRTHYRGSASGTYGTILENDAGTTGSSIAAPHVAGAAMMVKDWQLATGNTWINSNGRLHTMMLAMGDRHDGTSRRLRYSDPVWGMGRLKLRLLKTGQNMGPWGYRMTTYTLTTASTNKDYMVWSSPLPTDTEMLKCVLMEGEDMSSKNDVGDVYLTVNLRSPVSGSCSASGTTVSSRTDDSYDLKHLVAFEDAETNLEGACPQVQLTVGHVAATLDVHVFCYYAGVLDDEPN